MRKLLLSCFLVLSAINQVYSQNNYSTNLYKYDSLLNVSYGNALDYAGNNVDLLLDIYKPKNDDNCKRPILILLHGGAYIAGSKEDYDLIALSKDFAQKGWVVANINYRLGTHKTSNYTMYALCNNSLSQPCGYISDSAEVYRANYRAMQDAKGAIRFMKQRYLLDSSDVNNVFIAGESAGAITALTTAFTDQSSEKHATCFAIANAPNPDKDLNTYGCIPANNNLTRPDLGSIDGDLNLGNYDATVKGVGSFFGAILDLKLFNQSGNTPVVYLYHQGSDVVVNYKFGTLLGRNSWECFAQTNICQSYYYYPYGYGGESIRQYFATQGTAAPTYSADIINNYAYLNNCFSNGHAIDNFNLRSKNMAELFAAKIKLSANDPKGNCATTSVKHEIESELQVYPNPTNNQVNVICNANAIGSIYQVFNQLGITLITGKLFTEQNTIDLSNLPVGLYFIYSDYTKLPFKIVKN